MIRLLDVADDGEMRSAFDLGVEVGSADRPWFRPPAFGSWLIERRRPDQEERQELYGVFDGDLLTGTLLLWVPLADNIDKVYADLTVHPQGRRRGAGTALVEHLVDRVRQLQRHEVWVESYVPPGDFASHPYSRFARAHGFELGWVEAVRHLRLPVSEEKLGRLAATAAPSYESDYEVRTFVGRVPDVFLPGLAELMSLLAVDAPSGDFDFEAEDITPDRLRRTYAREEEQGRTRLSALAIHRRSGVVAAQSDLVLDDDPAGLVHQEGTFVHREHRGHRLGMATKAANLQLLQQERPGRPYVVTENAEDNPHMIDINVALGFEIVERLVEWVRKV
ncbi:GNAT family N-acetyltransferase [Flexivirga meconopsidis]|uniref:GNAT family N-acetyltransferase n=1 Tax=Flexivirga meconopsidis TaxID=2977121 RepID=UPI00223EC40E